ncbi:hypothetical protein KX928_07465 [Roseobacter sp. YSTF-M11]|uniref:Uncharacterized protein n=1 Tax=Roseobacter insulae TaxID=2859783 RepID=A0A9X1K2I8_9RHOB|nr:hypothetical protein [Roseobacter insulae]MBW4707622.1 hypothetical protein [Roseobacter insulae]
MSDTYAQFEKRVAVVSDKHRKLARGYVARIGKDGLITVEPKRAKFPIRPRAVVAAVAGVLIFKALMIVTTGLGIYESRIEALSSGTVFETGAAWVMQADPVSRYMAENIVKMLP